jgi:hypothetical protein
MEVPDKYDIRIAEIDAELQRLRLILIDCELKLMEIEERAKKREREMKYRILQTIIGPY